jgi:hypothetical protein
MYFNPSLLRVSMSLTAPFAPPVEALPYMPIKTSVSVKGPERMFIKIPMSVKRSEGKPVKISMSVKRPEGVPIKISISVKGPERVPIKVPVPIRGPKGMPMPEEKFVPEGVFVFKSVSMLLRTLLISS